MTFNDIKYMLEVHCNKHKKVVFNIPENIEECVADNSFNQIHKLRDHLRNNSGCKMIRSLRIIE